MITLLFLAAAASAAPVATAHELGVTRVEINEYQPGRYLFEAAIPSNVVAARPRLPSRCRVVSGPHVRSSRETALTRFDISCTEDPLAAGDTLILPWSREGGLVSMRWADGTEESRFFAANDGRIHVPVASLGIGRRSAATMIRHYLLLGFEHILLGWDHLAFVLGLCLIARGRRLVLLVTAFTIGHSLTLAAATLGFATLPTPPVEASIALSIVFIAREALAGSKGASGHRGFGLVLAFGLLHGLGFASVLSESAIERSELIPGLLSFNLGVEFGQLAFVMVVMAAARIGKQTFSNAIVIRPALARVLGVLGMLWTIERVFAFVA